MSLFESLKDKKFDLRLRDKWLADGRISKEEVDEYEKNLEDDGPNATTVSSGHTKKTV